MKPLTYEEFITLAMKHYNEGGDVIVECWDRKAFEDHGPITKSDAVRIMGLYEAVESEVQSYRQDAYEPEFEDEFCDYWEPEYRSSYEEDYSPSCPWNAPGMSVKDFI